MIQNDVLAQIDGNLIITATGTQGVSLSADSTPNIKSSALAGAVATSVKADAIAGAKADNEIGGSSRAVIKTAKITTNSGRLSVVANSLTSFDVDGRGAAFVVGIGAAVGAVGTSATVTSQTEASIGGEISADRLEVKATGTGVAKVAAEAATGGLIAGGINKATASLTPTVTVSVADGSKVDVVGDAALMAIGTIYGEAKSMGVAVGALAAGLSEAELSLKPTVHTIIGKNASLDADGKVTISSELKRRASDVAAGIVTTKASGGGVGGLSGSTSTQEVRADVATQVGDGAKIHGATGVNVTSASEIKLNDEAVVDTFGGGALQKAKSTEKIETTAKTSLGANANLMAERGAVNVTSQNNVEVFSRSDVKFLGVAGGGNATSQTTIGGLNNKKLAETVLGAGSSITAVTANVVANVERIKVDSDAKGVHASAVGSVATTSISNIDSTASVSQQANANITAQDIAVKSLHGTIDVNNLGEYVATVLVANQGGTVEANVNSTSELTIAQNAELAGNIITVQSKGATGQVQADAKFDAKGVPIGKVTPADKVVTHSTVNIAGRLLPGTNEAYLFVDKDGNVTDNRSFVLDTTVTDKVVVTGLVRRPDPGLTITAAKSTHRKRHFQDQKESVTIGDSASYTDPNFFTELKIENRSNKDLEINDIDVGLADAPVTPTITPAPIGTLSTTPHTTTVPLEILNTADANIILKGTIENPFGETKIHATGGSILDTNSAAGLASTRRR